jgi:hypothetical protein
MRTSPNINAERIQGHLELDPSNATYPALIIPAGSSVTSAQEGAIWNNGTNLIFSNTTATFILNQNTVAQSNQTLGFYAISNSTQSSFGTFDARSMSIVGAGIASVGFTNGSLVVSVPAGGGAGDGVNILGFNGGATTLSTTLQFSNSNGISIGHNAGTITFSHNGITSQSNQSLGFYASSNTLYTSSGTIDARSLSVRAEGIASIGYSAGEMVFNVPNIGGGVDSASYKVDTTTAAADPGAGKLRWNNATQTSATELYIDDLTQLGVDVSAYLGKITTGTVLRIQKSDDATVYQRWEITSITDNTGWWTIGVSLIDSNGGSIANNKDILVSITSPFARMNISAGTTSNNASRLVFADSNGISFGLNGSTVTATVKTDYQSSNANYLTSQSNQALSGSNGSFTFQTVTFGNLNGMSFYTSNGSMVASYTVPSVPAQTNQTIGFYALGNTTQNSSTTLDARTVSFNAIGSLTIGYSNGSVQFSAPNALTSQSNQAFSAQGGSSAFQTLVFTNSNGISFSNTNGSIWGSHNGITSQTNQNMSLFALGNTTQNSSTLLNASNMSFNAIGSLTIGYSNGSIQFSAPNALTSQSNQAFSAQGGSSAFQTLVFTNSNGISFSNTNGSIWASHNALTTARASTDAIGLNTAQSNVTWTVNSSGLSLNAAGYAGTGTTFNGANISGSLTQNSNGIQMSLSVAAPGAAAENNWFNLLGANTAGNTTASGSTIGLSGINVTLSGTNGSQIIISAGGGGAAYTAYTYQNRQFAASTTINSAGGQNSLWLAPVRLAVPVSASTILAAMISYSGTITSAATAQLGQTLRVAIWSQHTDPASSNRFDTWWTGGASLTFWNSGTSSYSYNFARTEGNTQSQSAGSNLGTASAMGVRQIILPINSTMPAGLYIIGVVNSTSSAGYSAAMSRVALYMDNPVSIGMGTIGQATNASIGFNDGGTFSVTTGGIPSSINIADIRQVNNVMPFFKIGAI